MGNHHAVFGGQTQEISVPKQPPATYACLLSGLFLWFKFCLLTVLYLEYAPAPWGTGT